MSEKKKNSWENSGGRKKKLEFWIRLGEEKIFVRRKKKRICYAINELLNNQLNTWWHLTG